MNEITYQNKVALNENPEIANKNKVTDDDMNEIKSVVNGNSRTSSNNFGLRTNTWTSSATYSIGDIVVYNDNTYKNLTGTNTTTTPDQDSTNWEVIPLIVNEKNNSTKNAYSCDYLDNNQANAKILWENPNPTSSFGTQDITLNSDDYDMLLWLFSTNNVNSQYISVITIKGKGLYVSWVYNNGFIAREINYVNSTTYSVGDNKSNGTTLNINTIPQIVIGYKTGLFS